MKLLSSILIFMWAAAAFSQTAEEKALKILQKYSPDGYEIITDYQNAPAKYKFENTSIGFTKNNGFKRYLETKNKLAMVNSISTAVHEMNHAYTGLCAYQHLDKKGFDDEFECYYLDNGEYVVVKLTETFSVKKMADKIPKKLQTFRYKTYMGSPSKFQSTQVSGIYGLLNEFNAYYQDSKTSYNLYNYYKAETKGKVADWQLWMQTFDGTYFAHAEFRYYILMYLIYAEKYQKAIFNNIMQNAEFKHVFNHVDKAYTQLIKNYQTRRETLLDEFREQKKSVSIDDKWTRIDGMGTGNYQSEYNLLMKEMEKQQYQKMLEKLKK